MDNQLTFNYSEIDTELSEFIQNKEQELVQIRNRYAIEVGKVFSEAQEQFADYNNGGLFHQWYSSLGFKKQNVYNYINIYNAVQNLDNDDAETFIDLPKSLQVELTKKSSDEDLNQQVLSGDITTHKQYKQLEKERKQEKQAKEKAQDELHKEQNKKQETIDNTDYELIDKLKEQRERLKESNRILEEKLEDAQVDNERYSDLQSQIEQLTKQQDDTGRKIDSVSTMGKMTAEVNHFVNNTLAPMKYSRAIQEATEDEVVQENLKRIIGMVDEWSKEMKQYMSDKDIIDV